MRSDNQIVALEHLAVVVSIASFAPLLVARTVRLWIDNSAGELQLAKGSARSADHNRLVHIVWTLAARFRIGLWVERVASEWNVADEPSREVPFAMVTLGAQWETPSTTWDLSELWIEFTGAICAV